MAEDDSPEAGEPEKKVEVEGEGTGADEEKTGAKRLILTF
jgi:hypothetical protein